MASSASWSPSLRAGCNPTMEIPTPIQAACGGRVKVHMTVYLMTVPRWAEQIPPRLILLIINETHHPPEDPMWFDHYRKKPRTIEKKLRQNSCRPQLEP